MRSCQNDVGYVAAGLFLFALCVHCPDWQVVFSVIGLILAALGILHFLLKHPSRVLETFGISDFSKKTALFVLFGLAIGVSFGNIYRVYCGQAAFPARLGIFVPVACLIGATEELVYRGFIQGLLRPAGRSGAIIFASLFHTAYKCALFTTFPVHGDVDIRLLGLVTFLGGSVLGGLKEVSGSTFPSLTAHAFFDLVVYGEFIGAPWWVWS